MEGYTKIGRIRPNYTGAWTAETAYTVLEMVKNEAGTASYIAKQDVPAGTPLTDEAYWAMVLDAGDVIAAAEQAAANANKAAQEYSELDGKVEQLSEEIAELDRIAVSWVDGGYISSSDGRVNTLDGYSYTADYIDISALSKICWLVHTNTNTGIAFYDQDKQFVTGIDGGGIENGTRYIVSVPIDAKYLRFTALTTYKARSYIYAIDVLGMGNKLGEMVRENNVNTAKNTLVASQYENSYRLVDYGNLITSIEPGRVYEVDGTIVGATSGHYHTNYIEIPDGAETLYLANVYYGEWAAWYDENKNFISGAGKPTVVQSWDVDYMYKYDNIPDNARYLRVSVSASQYPNRQYTWCSTKQYNPKNYKTYTYKATHRDYAINPVENPLDYNGMEFCVFNRCACIGDSITEGVFNSAPNDGIVDATLALKYSYPVQLQKMSGVQCDNYGVGGFTSVEWDGYAEGHFELAGHDVAIVNLGINDVIRNIETQSSETAIRSIILKLKAACKNIKIFLATIVPAYADGSNSPSSKYYIYNQMIRSLANELDDVYLIDLTKYSATHRNSAYAQGHLTALGYVRLAREYMSGIGYVIKTNPYEFKDIQFANTDWEYSDS